jgi:hypothetical protein
LLAAKQYVNARQKSIDRLEMAKPNFIAIIVVQEKLIASIYKNIKIILKKQSI